MEWVKVSQELRHIDNSLGLLTGSLTIVGGNLVWLKELPNATTIAGKWLATYLKNFGMLSTENYLDGLSRLYQGAGCS